MEGLLNCFVKSRIDKVFVLDHLRAYERLSRKSDHRVSMLAARDNELEQTLRMENTTVEECLEMLLSSDCTDSGAQDVVILPFRQTSLQRLLVRPPAFTCLHRDSFATFALHGPFKLLLPGEGHVNWCSYLCLRPGAHQDILSAPPSGPGVCGVVVPVIWANHPLS